MRVTRSSPRDHAPSCRTRISSGASVRERQASSLPLPARALFLLTPSFALPASALFLLTPALALATLRLRGGIDLGLERICASGCILVGPQGAEDPEGRLVVLRL